MVLKFNPFQPNKMVVPGMFTGRIEEVDTIEQCLFQAKNGNPQHFLIEGERGIGKSSLLFLVEGFASGKVVSELNGKLNFLTLSVDMGGVETQLDIVRTIARELKSSLSEREALKEKALQVWDFVSKFEVMGVKYHGGSGKPVSDDARDELVNNIAKLASSEDLDGIFIIIDEADAPPESADLGEFIKLFTERLTRKNCNNVLLGLSGLPSTISKIRASHESAPRVLEILRLEPLEPDERKQVIEKGLSLAATKNGSSTAITNEAMTYLCELSEGYPHFIQQFAYCAFAEDTYNYIDMTDVLGGAHKENGAIAQLGHKYFNEMYFGRISSSEYRKVLNTMAEYSDQWVPRKTLVRESGVKETTLNNALNALKAKNVILADEARAGYYRLPTKSFAAWINAIKSVETRADTDVGNLFEEDPDEDPAPH
jgi:hypothetical protein